MRIKSISKKARIAVTSLRESQLDQWQFPVDSFCPPDDEEDEITTMSFQRLNTTMPILWSMGHG